MHDEVEGEEDGKSDKRHHPADKQHDRYAAQESDQRQP